jgi:undecaprenyl diphosphate synthase
MPQDALNTESTSSHLPSPISVDITQLISQGVIRHVAIIMDGNRRWAEHHGSHSSEGHYRGYHALKTLIDYCIETLHLPVLTVYAFSTENWHRPGNEVSLLQTLFHQVLEQELDGLIRRNVRLRFLGDLDTFSSAFTALCHKAETQTACNTGMCYQVALNYGGRAEIIRACRALATQVKSEELKPEAITEADLSHHLYTGTEPDPDLVIRTGGEMRLSNFLLWQAAYAELYVSDVLWPDFTPHHLNEALQTFTSRQRRFGH